MKADLEIASALFAFVAAALWFRSALFPIPKNISIGGVTADGAAKSEDLNKLAQSMRSQSAWSAWAAGFAAAAALAQGIATLMG